MGLGWVDKSLHSLAHPSHRAPIKPGVVVQALVAGMEVQAPSAGGRVPRTRPVVAARAYVAHGRIVAVTSGGEEHQVPVGF